MHAERGARAGGPGRLRRRASRHDLRVTIRWATAFDAVAPQPVRFPATLYEDGRVVLRYTEVRAAEERPHARRGGVRAQSPNSKRYAFAPFTQRHWPPSSPPLTRRQRKPPGVVNVREMPFL